MSTLDIRHPTSLPTPAVREAAERIAGKLQSEFGIQCQWQGDVLHFRRSGIDGQMTLGDGAVHLAATLGFPYSAMQGMIEAQIRRVLAEKLPPAGA